jgi:hypothetical protein
MKPTTMMILMTTILAACHTQAPTPARPQSGELAARRAQLIGWLHDYYEAGQFPTDAAGQPQSVFVDAKGVRCPMAELIWRSGHQDLVEAVAREHNAVRLAEVTSGPLHDWMVGSGLTSDEISLVQGAMDLDMTWMRKETGELILANGARVEVLPNGGRVEVLPNGGRVEVDRVEGQPNNAIGARAEIRGRLEGGRVERQPNNAMVARAEIRGRLETAERVLKDRTAHSLDVATAHLPNGKVPTVTMTGTVVPKAALRSGPQFPHAPVTARN